MQARIGMINSVFGKQNSMDIQTVNMDKDLQEIMRKAFLWAKDGYMSDDRIRELENSIGVKQDAN